MKLSDINKFRKDQLSGSETFWLGLSALAIILAIISIVIWMIYSAASDDWGWQWPVASVAALIGGGVYLLSKKNGLIEKYEKWEKKN
jgi:uncharacterized BrkB/YihY/UPF0761 family membrane protein